MFQYYYRNGTISTKNTDSSDLGLQQLGYLRGVQQRLLFGLRATAAVGGWEVLR